MIPEAGQRFGPYEILGKLGSGGMGLVFRAWDERLHREVAIKLLHEGYNIPGMRERFLQEARAASALNHPNICTVFDIGEKDGEPYLVMELLEGETLKRRISRGAMEVEEIIACAEEIAEALSVAHAKGIVHRDVKPANVFLVALGSGRSQTKVLDFGLAKIQLEAGGGWGSRTLDLTLAGGTVGTLAYMSPEQARGESLDGRSDLFSLGVVMYEMTTRRPPFRGATSALMFAQLFDHDPEPMRSWNDSCPRELETLILKLLAKDRKQRYQTAAEVRLALGKVGAKAGRGWLQKGKPSAVPLVRAEDPIARHRLTRQAEPEHESLDTPSGKMEPISPGSSAQNILIRPMRMPDGMPVTAERGVLHPLGQAGSKEEGMRQRGTDAPIASRENRAGGQLAETTAPTPESLAFAAGGAQEEGKPGISSRWVWRGIVALLVFAAAAGLFVLFHNGLLRPMVLRRSDKLLLTTVDNKTGDGTLDGVVMQALEIALRQSDSLNVLGGEAYAAGLRQRRESSGAAAIISGQSVAQQTGAAAYVYGEITGTRPPYGISVEVLKTETNDKVATFREEAATREDIPAAIGRLALSLRREVSQDGKANVRQSIPFFQDATGNVEALQAFAQGEANMQHGRQNDALKDFQRAVTLDPAFPQAQLRLAWIYGDEGAELASSHAAELAKSAAAKSSSKVKMLAQFCYELNSVGAYGSAASTIRAYVAKYPRDVSGISGLARVLFMQQYLPESLLASEQGYGEDPFHAESYDQAEDALLALNRYDGVLQLAAQAKHEGVTADRDALAAAYMTGQEKIVAALAGITPDPLPGIGPGRSSEMSLQTREQYGRYLDSTGRMTAGLVLWKLPSDKAEETPKLSSAAASMLAQGAFDRALIEDCTAALTLVKQLKQMSMGPEAAFHTGMATALCGDETYAAKTATELQRRFPENAAVTKEYTPALEAAASLGVSEPAKALVVLASAGRDNRLLLLTYLRGLADQALGQQAFAENEFRTVLDHRGAAWRIGGTLYAMTEIEMARTYAAERNKSESISAYRTFLQLWTEADPGQPLMKEALARSK